MFEIKQNQRTWVPVRLFYAATGSGSIGVPAVPSTDINVVVIKSDTSELLHTASVTDWVEHSSSVVSGSGTYQLRLTLSGTNTAGPLMYVVKSTSSKAYIGSIKVVANEEVDTYNALAIVSSSVDRLREGAEGRWKIFTTGPDANRMVFYRPDGVTVLYKVDLKDAAGAATSTSPFERVPV